MSEPPLAVPAVPLGRVHARRLRSVYRSSGWPCLDTVEIELLAAGMLQRVQPPAGPEYLRVSDAGMQFLAAALGDNRKALDRHEALVQRVAEAQVLAGRIAFQGLTLLAKPDDRWLHLKPDVYSIRNTSREAYIEPVIHEIKVSRADLKTDLKKPEKRAGYIALSAECYYVLAEGIGRPDDVPPECGVMLATESRIELLRASPKRPMSLGFNTWMALAKSRRVQASDDAAEPRL